MDTENVLKSFSMEQVEQIVKSIPLNIFIKDSKARYVFISHSCSIPGRSMTSESLTGKTDKEVFEDPVLGNQYYEEDLMILGTGMNLKYLSEVKADGESFFYEIVKVPLYDSGRKISGIVGLVNDVTEMMRLQKELERLNKTDKMTGCFNRNYYENRLQQGVRAYELPFSVIMCDCNNLKFVNDTFGHKKGDLLLTETVRIILDNIPEDSDIIRLGGDEFLVLCPVCSRAECESIVNDIMNEEKKVIIGGIPISSSYGFDTITGFDKTLEEAVQNADTMMYSFKHRCRCP